MRTTPSEQWIARTLETAAVGIPLPPESRWVPGERARIMQSLAFAFAFVAAVVVLAVAAYFTVPAARMVPAQRPTEPGSVRVTNVGTITVEEGTCTYSGLRTFAGGWIGVDRTVIDVVNRSSQTVILQVLEVEPSPTLAEIEEYIGLQRSLIGWPLTEPPPTPSKRSPFWAATTTGESWSFAPGARGEIAALMWPATHFITCRLSEAAFNLIGPLQVTR